MVYLAGNDGTYDRKHFIRLLGGMKNNLPHLIPNARISANEKRRSLRKLGWEKPQGYSYSELPMAAIPAEVSVSLHRYIRKMTLALYYRHVGKIPSQLMRVWASWSHGQDRTLTDAIDLWMEMTPITDVGRRKNVDIGNAFKIRMNYSVEMDAFIVIGQINEGLIFFGTCMPESLCREIDWQEANGLHSRAPGDWS